MLLGPPGRTSALCPSGCCRLAQEGPSSLQGDTTGVWIGTLASLADSTQPERPGEPLWPQGQV